MTISVIIPTLNRSDYLCQTLDSVFAQTRLPDEVFVVDDGSTDDTRERVTAYPKVVRYIYQENRGPATARNNGMSVATGDALLFLDSDDLLLPGALEALEAALSLNPQSVLAYCRAQIIDASGAISEPLWQVGNEAERDHLWEALASVNFIRTTGCVLVRRTALESVGGWDESQRLEDWELWLRLAEKTGVSFVRVPEPLLQYRVHQTNLSHQEVDVYKGGRKIYLTHRERYPEGSVRRRYLDGLLKAYPAIEEGQAPMAEQPTRRHRILRTLLERGGIAGLYRRIPIGIRLRLRTALGIAPWTRS
jgi:GT2 family glycosyltransferase